MPAIPTGGRWTQSLDFDHDAMGNLTQINRNGAGLLSANFRTAGRPIDRDSDITLSGYLNYFDNGSPGGSDVQSAGITASYGRRFWRGLTGTAAASLTAFEQDGFNSQLIGSALVGLRYNF